MISGNELSFNIKNNETFVYDYITRLKHRNMTFEKKLDKLKDSKSKTSIHKCVDYVEAIEENKKEILFIYDEMKIKMRNEILNLSNKYLKEFLKYITITFDLNDRKSVKVLLDIYNKVYGWVSYKDFKKMLSEIFLVRKINGCTVVLGIKCF